MDYCCFGTTSPTSCTYDATVTGCPSGSDPYSCTGTESPETATSKTLLCGAAPANAAGKTSYCCTTA
jgi:hypothetical protein